MIYINFSVDSGLSNPSMGSNVERPQPSIFVGKLKSYQLKVCMIQKSLLLSHEKQVGKLEVIFNSKSMKFFLPLFIYFITILNISFSAKLHSFKENRSLDRFQIWNVSGY